MTGSTMAEALGFDVFAFANETEKPLEKQRYHKFDLGSHLSDPRKLVSEWIQSHQDAYLDAPDAVAFLYAHHVTSADEALLQFKYNGIGSMRARLHGLSMLPTWTELVSYRTQFQTLGTNPKLFHCVSNPLIQGPTFSVFDGPRGVLQKVRLSQTTWMSQKVTLTEQGHLKNIYAALWTDTNHLDVTLKWKMVTSLGSGSVTIAEGSIHVDAINGSYSDAVFERGQGVLLEPHVPYFIIFWNDNDGSASVYYNDTTDANANDSMQISKDEGHTWTSMDVSSGATVGSIVYQLSIQIDATRPYNQLTAPGVINLLGESYAILRCKEIEDNVYLSLAYSKHFLGLAKLKLGNFGVNETRMDYKINYKECHPIGKLTRLTLRFETTDGKLYDFKGHNHSLTLAMHYMVPRQQEFFKHSVLNPNYTGDYMEYQFKDEEDESDDQDIDYSRDYQDGSNVALENYRTVEQRNLPDFQHLREYQKMEEESRRRLGLI